MGTRLLSSWSGASFLLFVSAICPAAATAQSIGDAAAGQALFEERCNGCHTVQRLAGLGDRIINDLRQINARMSVVGLLWDEEVADLRAFLNFVPKSDSEKE